MIRRVSPSAGVAVALAVLGAVVSLVRPLAPSSGQVVTDLDRFDPVLLDAVAAYRAPRVTAFVVALLVQVVVPLVVVLAPWGRRLVGWLAGPADGSWRRAVVGGGAVAAVVWGLTDAAVVPLRAWLGLVHDGRWGIRTASAGAWWTDLLTAYALEVGMAAVLGAGAIALVRARPRTWHWHTVWMTSVLVAVVAVVWPIVVAPLFREHTPLEEGPVKAAARDVLDAAGYTDARLVVADEHRYSQRINAHVTGLGPTKTVVLDDTLLALDVDQVALVLAHEVAHREHLDIERGVLATATGVLPFALLLRWLTASPRLRGRVGARHAADPRLVGAAVALVLVGRLVADPVALWQSRQVEAAADHRALELSGEPATLVAVQRAFVLRNLAPVDRPAWLTLLGSTHPSVGQRIRAAVAYADRRGLPLPDLDTYVDAERQVDVPWRRPGG